MPNINHIKGFLSEEERVLVLGWASSIEQEPAAPNGHLSEISSYMKGTSFIFDLSRTEKSGYVAKYQSVSRVSEKRLPDFIYSIVERISKAVSLDPESVFLQVIDMSTGGVIKPHYDATVDGHINYKCNVSVLSEDYEIYVGDESSRISESDLYCFESSLYRHWTGEFSSRRVLLSFGFIVPYSAMGRTEDEPLVRMGKRIQKYFQESEKQKK